jgi:hypothetical protein
LRAEPSWRARRNRSSRDSHVLLCRIAACLALVAGAQAARAESGYVLGHGLHLGDSGFTLGGYGEASYAHVDDGDPDALELDALSAMLWWDGNGRLHFFSETELDDGLTFQDDRSVTGGARVVSERLYFDWVQNDALKFRLGKFLTPVGRWNVIHAAPLTWTTSRPLITVATFPTNATGVMVYGTLPGLSEGVEYAVYGSTGHELFENDEIDTFSEAVGGRLSATVLPNVQAGLSIANYEQESSADVHKQLYGVDFAWGWHRYELSGEFAWRTLSQEGSDEDEQGLYLQFVAPLSERWYGVMRYEHLHHDADATDLNLYLGGIVWRPMPALSFKAEFSQATDRGELPVSDGFRASIAVLF